MPTFSSRPLTAPRLNRSIKRNPALFGVPFILLMVVASYGLTSFTQARYDLHDQKVKQVRVKFECVFFLFLFLKVCVKVTKEQELGIDKNRKKFDIREEYFVSTSLPPHTHTLSCIDSELSLIC